MKIDRLIGAFEVLDDWEERYRQIIDLGRKLEPLAEEHRIEANRVHGCTSNVWLVHRIDEEGGVRRLHFIADSDAHIVRGRVESRRRLDP